MTATAYLTDEGWVASCRSCPHVEVQPVADLLDADLLDLATFCARRSVAQDQLGDHVGQSHPQQPDVNADGEDVCPRCGSVDLESDSFDSYGGTTEGYTQCKSCNWTASWADLSAVL